MNNYLEVKNLSKSFDNFRLHDITFTLPKGYIMGPVSYTHIRAQETPQHLGVRRGN